MNKEREIMVILTERARELVPGERFALAYLDAINGNYPYECLGINGAFVDFVKPGACLPTLHLRGEKFIFMACNV